MVGGAEVVTARFAGGLFAGTSLELQLDKPNAVAMPTATKLRMIRPEVQKPLFDGTGWVELSNEDINASR